MQTLRRDYFKSCHNAQWTRDPHGKRASAVGHSKSIYGSASALEKRESA